MRDQEFKYREDEEKFQFEISLPGYTKDEIELHLDDSTMILEASIEEKKSESSFLKQSFRKSFALPPHYDSMICKLVSYGRTRKIALDRMYRALSEYIIRGIDTNIDFLKAVILDPAFRQGEATTSYIEEFLSRAPKDLLEKPVKESKK